MSSRFLFRSHVSDIELKANKSPHSNCSNHSTPKKLATPHSNSVSPNTNSSNNSINGHYKPPSQLKILLPEHPEIATRDSIKLLSLKRNDRTASKPPLQKPKVSHLTVPSDSENLCYSSPLLSEPSPNPPSPVPLTLNRSSVSNKSTKSSSSPPPDTAQYAAPVHYQTTHQPRYAAPPYPGNHSPISTTSSYYDNLTPLYTAHILELTQDTNPPDLSLAPLSVLSPTPLDCHIHTLQIINKQLTPQPTPKHYLLTANTNYNSLTDSDYDFDSDIDLDQLQTDFHLEQHLIAMGCCCSQNVDDNNKKDTATNMDDTKEDNAPTTPNHQNTEAHIEQNIKLQIKENKPRKPSFADKYFRSKAQVAARNKKLDEKEKQKNERRLASPRNGSTQHSADDDYPPIPIPKDAKIGAKGPHALTNQKSKSKNLSLLEKLDDATETQTYNTFDEQKDLVSPIVQLDKVGSLTNVKRPSSSALSSPLHSVRLSITPKGHLAPITILDHSDDDIEDHSLSTTDSKEDANENTTKYSEINTPVHFLKKNKTITKFVSSAVSQTSDRNVLLRRKRRQGVSERHTLTFSKPPIPAHELPSSPKFAEIELDVMKPRDFLAKILKDNLLFSGVDREFSSKMVSKVVELMRAADFEEDEILIHQGAEGDAFYAVEYGTFDILVMNNETMEEKKVAVASSGDCVGEYALLYNQPRTATLKSTCTSRVWGITAEQFAQMRQEIMDWNVERFEKRQQFIHSIPLFQKLEQHELLNMTHACHAEIYDINDFIIPPNADNSNVYIIMEGTVMVSYDRVSTMDHLRDMDLDEEEEDIEEDDEVLREEDDELVALQDQHKLGLTLQASSSFDVVIKEQRGKPQYHHPVGTDTVGITDPPIMEDIDNNIVRVNLKAMRGVSTDSIASQQLPHRVSDRVSLGLNPLSLSALNSANSVHSVHVINQINIDMGACRGDKELGPSDYFARNLFYENSYDEEEIVCARAHTRCKVLKIARDDFILIMAATAHMNNSNYLFNDNGVLTGNGTLPDTEEWKNKITDLQLSDLEERDVLGIGSFGRVTLVENKNTGATYALKSVSKYRVVKTGQEEHIINEKRVLCMLDSPFCVKLYATFKTESTIYFLTEVVLGGELFTVLRYNEKFDKNATRFYAGCVVMALEHLHSMDIIYRDLKPENLLLNSAGYLQLTDFGFAKKRNTTCTLCGTPQYLAPEVIHNWVQSFATDWWALGVLLYEMVVGHPPFEDDENRKMYEKILVDEPEFPTDINSKLRHLIQNLLEKNAYQRLGSGAGGARQVKQHPFFRNKLSWQDLCDMKLEPPYKPNIDDNFDTSNFNHYDDYEYQSSDDEDHQIDPNSPHFRWVDQF